MSNSMKNSTTTVINVVCAIVFLVFVFSYLYFYQADVLALAQHVWSSRQTHYDRTIGASLITFVLGLLTLGISAITDFPRRVQTLVYLPALMLLGVLTSAYPLADGSVHVSIGCVILAVLSLVCFAIFARSLSEYRAYESPLTGFSLLSQTSWANFSILAAMLVVTCCMGNNDGLLHRQLRMERLVSEGKFDDALKVNMDYRDADSSMTMLQVYCLASQGRLGEDLFKYPLCGGSKALLPTRDKSVRFRYTSAVGLWRLLGAAPGEEIKSARSYFLTLKRQGYAKPVVTDYDLVACLLDCDLDAFASGIRKVYDFRSDEEKKVEEKRIEKLRKAGEEDTLAAKGPVLLPQERLPKYYRQALVLYTRTHSQRVLTYTDNVVDADYDDYLKLERRHYDSVNEKEISVGSSFAGTYWYYYRKNKK